MLTEVLTLQLRRSVDLTVEAVTPSWALIVDALGWNFLEDKPLHHDKVSFIERVSSDIIDSNGTQTHNHLI